MEPIRLKPSNRRSDLSREHKVAFGLLVFLGLGGVILGFLSFGASIKRPLDLQFAEYAKEGRYLSLADREAQELEQMKQRDTDGDGLTDYDETYIFKTSAYLSDTDSDGFDDQTEVFSGNNPNCPQGRDCGGSQVEVAARPSVTIPDIANLDIPQLDPETQALLAELESGQAPPTPVAPSTGELSQEKAAEQIEQVLKNYTPEQIRASLVQVGIDPAVLEGVDDAVLKQIFRKALDQALAAGELEEVLTQIAPVTQ